MIEWLKSHLVDDWHQGWKWFSVQAQALALAFLGAWLFDKATVESALGEWTPKAVLAALIVMGLGGRFMLQNFSKKDGQ